MRYAFPAEQIRAAEAPLLAADVPLMRQAARAVATHTIAAVRKQRKLRKNADILVLVGGGNNGGDGLWAAHDLARRGLRVVVMLATEQPHCAGLAAARTAGVSIRQGIELDQADRYLIWLDALAGIGVRGQLHGALGETIAALAALREERERYVIAVDTPSGLADDPAVMLAIRADETITFGAAKPALLLPPACRLAGEITVHKLGIEPIQGETVGQLGLTDLAELWPRPRPQDHKYCRGVVGIDAGSVKYPGAGLLATRAALATGPGMVRYLGPTAVAPLVIAALPEAVITPGRIDAALIGPGTEGSSRVRAAFGEFCALGIPVVLDAGALKVLADFGAATAVGPSRLVLTPHHGELAALLGVSAATVARAPESYAREAARRFGAVVVVKGPETLVCDATGPIYLGPATTPWLATAGTGDVLAGSLAALLAQFAVRTAPGETVPPLAVQACLATVLHGQAVKLVGSSTGPIRASELADQLGRALRIVLATQ